MLYKSYEQKIEKIAKIVEKILKYKILISCILGFILACVVALLSVRGMMTEDLVLSGKDFIYGESYSYSAEALMKDVSYEFYSAETGKWTEEKPILPGTYKVRAVSRRTFGIKNYSNQVSFTISKKSATINVRENSVIYGTDPTATAIGLISGDTVKSAKFDYLDGVSVGNYKRIVVDLENIVIVNANGKDVTDGYDLSATEKRVSIDKREVVINTEDKDHLYDGKELVNDSYTADELVYGDYFDIISYGDPITEVIESRENAVSYQILDKDGLDASGNYIVRKNWGRLTIKERPVKITAQSVKQVYDGNTYACTEVIPDEANATSGLLDGHFIDGFTVIGERKTVGTRDLDFIDATICDEFGTPKTSNYKIEYVDGTIEITKRQVAVYTDLELKSTYNNEQASAFGMRDSGHSGGCFLYKENSLPFVDGHSFKLSTNDVIAKTYSGKGGLIIEILDQYNGDENVANNYEMDIENVSIIIDKRPITITPSSYSWVYDGMEHSLDMHEYIDNIVLYQQAVATIIGSIQNVGEVDNIVASWDVLCDGVSVKDNYEPTINKGTLEITACPINITFVAEKVYDGTTAVPATGVRVESIERLSDGGFGLYNNQQCVIKSASLNNTGIKNAGTYFDVVSTEFDFVENGTSVYGNYEICNPEECGKYIITPRQISVSTAYSLTKAYDRKGYTEQEIEFTTDGLVEFHSVRIDSFAAESKFVDSGLNSAEYTILDENGEPIEYFVLDGINYPDNYNYHITENFGTYQITERRIMLKLDDVQVIYNGKPVECPTEYTDVSEEYGCEGVLEGDSFEFLGFEAEKDGVPYNEVIDAGKYSVSGTSLEINYAENDYIGYYNIQVQGTITVDKCPITAFTEFPITTVYDATQQHITNEQFSYQTDSLELVEDHIAYIFTNDVIAKNYKGVDGLYVSVKDHNNDNRDVTNNYDFNIEDVHIVIHQRPIYIEAESYSWTYDGTEHSLNECKISGVLESQTAEAATKGSITNVGTVDNIVESWDVKFNGESVKENYRLVPTSGVLEVVARPIEVTFVAQKEYDGTTALPAANVVIESIKRFSKDGEYVGDGLCLNHQCVVKNAILDSTKVCKDAGVYNGVLSADIDIIDPDANGEVGEQVSVLSNYVIRNTENGGLYEITPKIITVSTSKLTAKGYDRNGYKIEEIGFTCDGLIDSLHTIEINSYSAQNKFVTNVPVESSVDFTIFDENGEIIEYFILDGNTPDKYYNYHILEEYGTYQINIRHIKLQLDTVDTVYDGNLVELSKKYTDVSLNDGNHGLLDGDTIEITEVYAMKDSEIFWGGITDAGEYSVLALREIIYPADEDYQDYYNIEIYGTVNVHKRQVSLTGQVKNTYDGKKLTYSIGQIFSGPYALTNDKLTYVDGYDQIVDGHTLTVSTVSPNANTYYSSNGGLTVSITDSLGVSVSHNYIVDISGVSMTIDKREIVITPIGGEMEYDGDMLSGDGYEPITNLVEGHHAEVVLLGSIKDVGQSFVSVDGWEVYAGTTPVTDNYTAILNTAEITITPCQLKLTITANKEYDGTAEMPENVLIKFERISTGQTGLFANDTYDYTLRFNGEAPINVGEYTDCLTADFVFKNGLGEISYNYEVVETVSTYSIEKHSFTIRTDTIEKTYDGTGFSEEEIGYIYSGLLDIHEFKYISHAASNKELATNAENSVEYEIIDKATGQPVSQEVLDSYNVRELFGRYSITKRKLYVEINEVKTVYSGNVVANSEEYWIDSYKAGQDSLLDGDTIDLENFVATKGGITYNEIIDAGEYSITADCIVNYGNSEYTDYYEVVSVKGEVYVAKSVIIIRTSDASKKYDGNPLSNEVYTVQGELAARDNVQIRTDTMVYGKNETMFNQAVITVNGVELDRFEGDNEGESIYMHPDGEELNYEFKTYEGTLTVYE